MKIAAGKPEEIGVNLKEIKSKDYINDMVNNKFNGYICITIGGKTGVEEGVLFFRNGKILLANYEYFKYNTEFKKEQAAPRVFNALASKTGVLDKFSVTDEQAKLIITLKEDELIGKEIKVQISNNFSEEFENEIIKKAIKERGITKEDILRKYGIASLRATEASKEELMYRSKQEDIDIRRLVEK